jgi:hypothetical protein
MTIIIKHALRFGWEFCNKTPGCTLRGGHGGACKPAKGF